jgi:hypothetical protein
MGVKVGSAVGVTLNRAFRAKSRFRTRTTTGVGSPLVDIPDAFGEPPEQAASKIMKNERDTNFFGVINHALSIRDTEAFYHNDLM